MLCLGAFLALGGPLFSEQLPLRVYDIGDGLAGDGVEKILADSRGYLWFATYEGISRFDGVRFTSYGVDDGLPDPRVNDLLEARDGTYWFATRKGLARLQPDRAEGEPAFQRVPLAGAAVDAPVLAILEDRAGRIWAGGLERLDVLEKTLQGLRSREVPLTPPLPAAYGAIEMLAETRDGSLWIGTEQGLLRRLPDERLVRYPVWPAADNDRIHHLSEDRHGNLWIGHGEGLFRFRPEPPEAVRDPGELRLYDRAFRAKAVLGTGERIPAARAPGDTVCLRTGPTLGGRIAHHARDGRTWISDPEGLFVLTPDGLFSRVPDARLGALEISSFTEDRSGNLWVGTRNGGAARIAPNGFVSFSEEDGFPPLSISALLPGGNGEIYVLTKAFQPPGIFLHRFDGLRFHTLGVNVPEPIRYLGWGWGQSTFRDHAGEWWVATGEGLVRFPRLGRVEDLATARPSAIYTRENGLGGNEVFRLYEDRRGDLWISTFGARTLTRFRRATETFESWTLRDDRGNSTAPTAFAEDRAGHLWIGTYEGGLLRFRDGRFDRFTSANGAPDGFIHALHLDHAGRLWIASGQDGAARVDNPAAPRPRFVRYTTREGLATNSIRCLVEDASGRMYLGGTKGIDRLDPATGRVRRFSTGDGLTSNLLRTAFRDAGGSLWFGTTRGLSRLDPRPDTPTPPPPVWITGVRINGVLHRSELGVARIDGLSVPPGPSRIEIEYVAPDFTVGERMRYELRLEGIDRSWGSPSERRSILYGSLPPGRFRFLVRAVTSGGTVSPGPAVVSFTIHPPLWRRWWFLTGTALLGTVLGTALYRWRVASLLAIERMRTGITRDLHDDLGSSLSRISILSEVVRRRVEGEPEAFRLLGDIGETSRELMESLSDSIWAIDPARDDLRSFVTRIRRFAGDLLEARGIAWKLDAPADADLRLSPVERRQLYLIVKEALHNVVKHSEARIVSLTVSLPGRRLAVEIVDDGQGFDPAHVSGEGHGLRSLRSRAEALDGKLEIDSAPGRGTRVRAEVALS